MLGDIALVDTIVVNQLHVFPVTATDPDTLGPAPFAFNNLTFSLDQASSDLGMAVAASANNGEGDFSWAPTEVGTYDITLSVDDDGIDPLGDSQDFQLVVVPATCPRLDVIGDNDMLMVDEGMEATPTFVASNECPAGSFTFGIDDASIALGMSVDAASGAFSWLTSEIHGPDNYTVTASVSDGDSTNTRIFVVQVNEVNLAPALMVPGEAIMVERIQADPYPVVEFLGTASDPDTLAPAPFTFNELRYSLDNPPDPAMTIGDQNGMFTWTPSADGTFDVTVVVTDDGDPAMSDQMVVTIQVETLIDPQPPIEVGSPGAFCSVDDEFDIDWDPVEADRYIVQFSEDQSFTNPFDSVTVTTSSAKAPLSTLEFDRTYYFRIIAERGNLRNRGDSVTAFTRWEPQIQIQHTLAYPKATESADFRMISIPGQSQGITAASTFSGRQAADGPLRPNGDWDWSMWRDNSDNTDYPGYLNQSGVSDTPFEPGVGYWAISTSAWQVPQQMIDNAPLTNDRFFGIPLNTGSDENDLRWTMIGNPFDFPILWQDLIAENGLVESFELWDWTGQGYQTVTVMEPYKGYYYFNSKNDPTLRMPCILTPVAPKTEIQQTAASPALVVSLHKEKDAQSPAMSQVTIKAREGGEDGFDRYDRVVPPAYFESHRVTLVNRDMEMDYPFLIEETRASFKDEHVFNVELKAEPGEPVYLNIDGLDALADREVYLFDDAMGRSYNVHEDPVILIEPEKETSQLRLLVGGKDFITLEQAALTPDGFRLKQSYPNPFVNQTTIEYALPDPDYVVLEVYNVLGQRVRTLVDKDQDSGYHQISWDGTSDSGDPVASGVYLYVFRSSTYQATERLVRVQ